MELKVLESYVNYNPKEMLEVTYSPSLVVIPFHNSSSIVIEHCEHLKVNLT